MSREGLQTDEIEFLGNFLQHAPQLMWFIGAGASRSSGLPTAQDLIWDLKRRYYCAKENQDVQAHKLTNHAIKARIQDFFEGRGCPEAGSPQEYTFFFELLFGEDHGVQQSYINGQLSPEKVTLTIGERVLASFLEMGRTRLVFTTNFDAVLEAAYAAVTGKNLTAFHIEGSYAALDALNADRFPIYVKVHGDFRYRSIKNLSKDLLANDAELQRCFVASAARCGLVVTGYSGRDANVMSMFEAALQQPNAFPHGVWWTTPHASNIAPAVWSFIDAARARGVRACVVETGPFDVMMAKLWRQLSDKPRALDDKVRSARAQAVSIPLPKPGVTYPILRTNALDIMDAPRRCGAIAAVGTSAADVFGAVKDKRPQAVVSYHEGVIFWGESAEVTKSLGPLVGNDIATREVTDPPAAISASTYLKSFYEQGVAEALCHDKAVFLRKKGKACFAVVDHRQANDQRLEVLKNAVGFHGSGPICGTVSGLPETFWAEAVRLKLEVRAGVLRLLLEPDIWVKPLTRREDAKEFLRARKLKRYNNQSYDILSAWIEILLGAVGQGAPVTVTYAAGSAYPAAFTVSTRTAFSRRGAA